ncbi:hypothetical protein Poly30_38680 [Planctomycetes bacterium Poly30]|uniref:CcmD family protein n=1 Tax=Saltatorellus ferox TaxID=2528018 RepID=A0A518EW66_9BACT|nr:hypothetical protein Poly30_38680 [Planctomycetes bacterium Poly30]
MTFHPLILGGLGLALIMFFTWALELHRTQREILAELKRVREELELQNRRPR